MNLTLIAVLLSFIAFAIAAAICAYVFFAIHRKEIGRHDVGLDRHAENPLIAPGDTSRDWEIAGTFNPAAIVDDGGDVHLLYRAIGSDGISRLGYALSKGGTGIHHRSEYPAFSMRNPRHPSAESLVRRFDRTLYPSGGSWGGCEDPRMVRMAGRIYLTFNAFDGWDFIRIAVTSIDERKFFKKQWDWSEPFLISPAGSINKNWVLFPEKIGGKFAILHSISPSVQVDYVDYLEELANGTKSIVSRFGQKKPRETWDTWVRGAGPPPVKTDRGWLVLYHAMDKRDPHIGYKIGAMLLDLDDPSRILARSTEPILTPEQWYENDGKPGVVYACGAVVKGDVLSVYYGGGDRHVCSAQTSLSGLLDWLMFHGKQPVQTINQR